MKTPRYVLARLLADKTLSNPQPQQLSREIAAYLLDEGRTAELDSLLRDMMEYRAEGGIIEVKVISAHPLTPALKQQIRTEITRYYPQAKEIIISMIRDETLLGGVRLEFANRQLDLSIRTKLSRFKQLTAAGRN